MIEALTKLNKKITDKDEFMNTLEELREHSKDYIVEPTKISVLPVEENGLSIAFKDKEFILHETAKKELALKLKIPYTYFSMLLESGHTNLLLKNINELLQDPRSPLMIRTTDNIARAVLSDRYKRLDNLEVAKTVLQHMDNEDLKIKDYCVTMDEMFIKFINTNIYSEVEPGDIVNAGFMIANSETGMKKLRITAFYERLACTNGMVIPNITDDFQLKHLGKRLFIDQDNESYKELSSSRVEDYDIWKYNAAISKALEKAINNDKFTEAMNKMRELKKVPVKCSPDDAVKVLGKMYSLAEYEQKIIKKHYLEDEQTNGLNAFGLVNAVTRTAQDITNYTKSTKFETIGGELNSNIKLFTGMVKEMLEKRAKKEAKKENERTMNLYEMMNQKMVI